MVVGWAIAASSSAVVELEALQMALPKVASA
jgi:hypothetical protein